MKHGIGIVHSKLSVSKRAVALDHSRLCRPPHLFHPVCLPNIGASSATMITFHVLEHLHMPAIESAGYKPIPPNTRGSDLIHAEIINLESADLVLCDISTLNPNVFFELGIRTSLNKPVCYVKNEFTKEWRNVGISMYHDPVETYAIPLIKEIMENSFDKLDFLILRNFYAIDPTLIFAVNPLSNCHQFGVAMDYS